MNLILQGKMVKMAREEGLSKEAGIGRLLKSIYRGLFTHPSAWLARRSLPREAIRALGMGGSDVPWPTAADTLGIRKILGPATLGTAGTAGLLAHLSDEDEDGNALQRLSSATMSPVGRDVTAGAAGVAAGTGVGALLGHPLAGAGIGGAGSALAIDIATGGPISTAVRKALKGKDA